MGAAATVCSALLSLILLPLPSPCPLPCLQIYVSMLSGHVDMYVSDASVNQYPIQGNSQFSSVTSFNEVRQGRQRETRGGGRAGERQRREREKGDREREIRRSKALLLCDSSFTAIALSLLPASLLLFLPPCLPACLSCCRS